MVRVKVKENVYVTVWKKYVTNLGIKPEDLVRVGCLHSIDTMHDPRYRAVEAIWKLQRADETRRPSLDPRTTKTTTGRGFLIDCFFITCLKKVADYFFGTRPSDDWGDNSARQCSQVPDYFRKNAADRPNKDRVLSGSKQSWVKWSVKLCNSVPWHIHPNDSSNKISKPN